MLHKRGRRSWGIELRFVTREREQYGPKLLVCRYGPTRREDVADCVDYRTNLLRSVFCRSSPMAPSTSGTSMTTLSAPTPPSALYADTFSGAWNETSSTIFSRTVCSRRAPMLSTVRFTSAERSAMYFTASSVKLSSTPSVSSSARCCFRTFASGSVRMRSKSSAVRPLSSTLIGSRPCSSASMSLGLHW